MEGVVQQDAGRERALHRVFRRRAGTARDPADAVTDLRAFLRSLGLVEQPSGSGYAYFWSQPSGGRRQFATLHAAMRSVTVYLYPDALGRAPGHAAALYRALDEAGFGMGSKLGPSIGFELDDATRLRLFRDGLAALFDGNGRGGEASG